MRILICDDDALAIEQIHKNLHTITQNVLKLFHTPAERIY